MEKDVLELALAHEGEVDFAVLARLVGYTEEEQKWAGVFWDAAFNSSWILLADYIIQEWMGYVGEKCVANFHRDMKKKYRDQIDYKEIDKEHELVKKYLEFHVDIDPPGNRKKYYAITGHALKKMLMRAGTKNGDKICDYFIKTEALASVLKDFVLQKATNAAIAEAAKATARVEELESKIETRDLYIQDLEGYRKLTIREETVYIMSNRKYGMCGMFKIGRTAAPTGGKKRATDLNAGCLTKDSFVVLHEFKVYSGKQAEKLLHDKLNTLRVEKDREFFRCPLGMLIEICDRLLDNDYSSDGVVYGDFDIESATDEEFKNFILGCATVYKETIGDHIRWRNFKEMVLLLLSEGSRRLTLNDIKKRVKRISDNERLQITFREIKVV